MFKKIAHVFLALEVAHALGADNAFGPLTCDELVEVAQVEGTAAIEHPCAYTILVAMRMFCVVMVSATAMSVLIVMMVMSAMRAGLLVFMMVVLVAIMMLMLVGALMVVCVFLVMMRMLFLVVRLLMMRLVQFLYPFG